MIVNNDILIKIQSVELNILKVFIQFCNHYNIKYYLLGGTMLGAVRHQGFIPWDDDIDVGMLRADYEFFLKRAPEFFPDYYFIQSVYSEPDTPFSFTKIRDSRTTFIETTVRDFKINHGIYIDVFPLDYYPESMKEQQLMDKKKRELTLRIRKNLYISDEYKGSFFKELEYSLVGMLLTIKYPKFKDAILERERLYTSVAESNMLINHSGAWGKKELVPKSWYGDGVIAHFEGLEVIIPAHYDKWLTQVYGDYMLLPPEDKRIPHHYTDVIDLERSYLYYCTDKR